MYSLKGLKTFDEPVHDKQVGTITEHGSMHDKCKWCN